MPPGVTIRIGLVFPTGRRMLAAIRNVERELERHRLPIAVGSDAVAVAVARHLTSAFWTRKSHGEDRGQDLGSIPRFLQCT